jgi:BMFP domain-containing protein YqiC
MAIDDDKGSAGSRKLQAEASAGRIGDDVQRARENISGATASARDDISADLHRLSADVVSLRDTVAKLAKTVAAEVGEAASDVGEDIASTAKDQGKTLLSEFDSVVRRYPFGVLIGAFAIGMLFGLKKGRH